MQDILLEVENLKKYFPVKQDKYFQPKKYVKAVDDVSFNIRRGEIVGLVGESGSGKTTVGKTMLNLIDPTGGSVRFEDRLLFDVEAGKQMQRHELELLRQNMQMVFQDPYASLDPRMNVEKIITEGILKFKTCPRNAVHQKAVELVEECGLDASCLLKYPHQFSGGQRQRIGIARAISMEPKLIICDEPTAALDVSIQSQVLNLMLELRKKHDMSYLFISHNLGIVQHFCNRVCVMYLGSIVEIAEAGQLFSNCAHPYTAALLEATPSVKEPKSNRILLSGEIPSPSAPPSGCKFHPRCSRATERCARESPVLRDIGNGHLTACHLYS